MHVYVNVTAESPHDLSSSSSFEERSPGQDHLADNTSTSVKAALRRIKTLEKVKYTHVSGKKKRCGDGVGGAGTGSIIVSLFAERFTTITTRALV